MEAKHLAKGPGHPFYSRLNEILAQHGFDRITEAVSEKFYASGLGRPSLPPSFIFA